MGFPIGWGDVEAMPQFDEWLASEFWWDCDPADVGDIPRVTEQKQNRVARLKALGNAQVPACAAMAWRLLIGQC